MIKYDKIYDLDDPKTTLAHRDIIKAKPFLKKIYEEWYNTIIKSLKDVPEGDILEIGSGGGFLKEIFSQIITSDIMPLECCDKVFSAEDMPYEENTLSAIVMVNVFHHIPNPSLFLKEAGRTLKKGGKVIMIEPANSLWGKFIYRNFHHEPFDTKGGWEINSSGPLSGSNQALPYIYFERDKTKYRQEFPGLKINSITYHTPLMYLLSGGVSRKAFVPNKSYALFKFVEKVLSPLSRQIGMFQTIELQKINL